MQAQSGSPARVLAPASPGQAYVVVQGGQLQVPADLGELRALRAQRQALSDQITNVQSRRKSLADQLRSSDPAARKGLEDRLRVIDDRIVRMEQDLDRTGLALQNTPPSLLAAEVANPVRPDIAARVVNDLVPLVAILSVFVFAPMAIALSRFIWRRAAAPPQKQLLADQAAQQRLDQLQHAVDTIAIEVERISEGQRFLSKVLTDEGRALSSGSESGRR